MSDETAPVEQGSHSHGCKQLSFEFMFYFRRNWARIAAMRQSRLSVIALVLAAFMANFFALSFSTEALADSAAYHRSHSSSDGIVVDIDITSVDSDNGDLSHTGPACGHSCHAGGHLQGMIADVDSVNTVPVQLARFPNVVVPAPHATPETQHRPPRTSPSV